MGDSKAVKAINRARLDILHKHTILHETHVRLTNSANASFLWDSGI